MPLKVSIVGEPSGAPVPNSLDSLILQALGLVGDTPIEIVGRREADLILIYPYRYPFSSTTAGAVLEAGAKRLAARNKGGAEALLRKIYRIPTHVKMLAVSHENLDRRPWQAFGNLIMQTDIPRLTFWPQALDPQGFRFPYWWNYADWPQIPRPNRGKFTRFGAFYDLDVLCEPQDLNNDGHTRQDKAVWLTNHLEFPRGSILDKVKESVEVDVVTGVPWGQKLELLQSYRYCITTENSTGYGYETEKILEARTAGCVPVGYVQNPFSDFASASFFFTPPTITPKSIPPLLKSRPNLAGLLTYLSEFVLGN